MFKTLRPQKATSWQVMHYSLESAFPELLLKVAPHNGEHDALHAVGEDAGAQATSEEADDTILGNDILDGLWVAHALSMRLLVGLDNADAVGAAVADDAGAEANEGIAAQLLQWIVVLGQASVEEVEGGKPRQVTWSVWRARRMDECVVAANSWSKSRTRVQGCMCVCVAALPTNVALEAARAPWYSTVGPRWRTLFTSMPKPSFPSTCTQQKHQHKR